MYLTSSSHLHRKGGGIQVSILHVINLRAQRNQPDSNTTICMFFCMVLGHTAYPPTIDDLERTVCGGMQSTESSGWSRLQCVLLTTHTEASQGSVHCWYSHTIFSVRYHRTGVHLSHSDPTDIYGQRHVFLPEYEL